MRPIISNAIVLAASALVATSAFAQTTTPAPSAENSAPLWTATAPGRPTLLLLPTIHKLAFNDPRVDDWLSQVAGRAEAVVLEAPIVLGQKDLPTINRHGLYAPRDNMTNHVMTLTAESLAGCARQSQLDIVRFFQMKPWLASMTVDARRWRHHTSAETGGAQDPQFSAGIDERLLEVAQRHMVPVIYLETLDEALTLYDGMPSNEQEAMLTMSCAGLTRFMPGEVDVRQLQQAWLDSDIAQIEQLVTSRDPLESPSMHDADRYIMHTGTKNFAAAIERYGYFHGKGPILVAVGAGHFVGDDTLLDRLSADGYSITPSPGIVRTASARKPDSAAPALLPQATHSVSAVSNGVGNYP